MLKTMRWPETCVRCEQPKPRSFAALMEMYEHNYMRLKCLCPDVKRARGHIVSHAPRAHDLHLTILDQARHTTTLVLTYEMENGDLRPDVTVRIYHDARVAEVLSRRCRLTPGHRIDARDADIDSALSCRWRMNRFLYKWLNYCHRQGHNFLSLEPSQTASVPAGDPEVFGYGIIG
ncbi:MAG: DUF1249 domain-containing protein [Thiotrichales bacterium]